MAKEVAAQRFGLDKSVKNDMVGSFIRHGLTEREIQGEIIFQMYSGHLSEQIHVLTVALGLPVPIRQPLRYVLLFYISLLIRTFNLLCLKKSGTRRSRHPLQTRRHASCLTFRQSLKKVYAFTRRSQGYSSKKSLLEAIQTRGFMCPREQESGGLRLA